MNDVPPSKTRLCHFIQNASLCLPCVRHPCRCQVQTAFRNTSNSANGDGGSGCPQLETTTTVTITTTTTTIYHIPPPPLLHPTHEKCANRRKVGLEKERVRSRGFIRIQNQMLPRRSGASSKWRCGLEFICQTKRRDPRSGHGRGRQKGENLSAFIQRGPWLKGVPRD